MSSLRDLCPDFIRGYMDIIPSGFVSGFHPGLLGYHLFGICVRISSGVMWISSLRDLWSDFIRVYGDFIPSGFGLVFYEFIVFGLGDALAVYCDL